MALIGVGLLLFGCSDGPDSASTTAGLSMPLVMQDMQYDSVHLSGQRGQIMRIDLENRGDVMHSFTIERMPMRGFHTTGESMPHADDERHYDMHVLLESGMHEQVEFEPTEPGIFEYFCTIPGHREAGMRGTLRVH